MRLQESKTNFYTKKAKAENYPARSVYKLLEINKKHCLVKEGDYVLDLGCAPGSWLIHLSRQVGPGGRVVGVDVNAIKIATKKNIIFLKRDVMKLKSSDLGKLGDKNGKYQAVLSDLSPSISGVSAVDDEKTLELGKRALKLAIRLLSKDGSFLCKFFEGGTIESFIEEIKPHFGFVKRFHSNVTRRGSRELYIVAKGFKQNS